MLQASPFPESSFASSFGLQDLLAAFLKLGRDLYEGLCDQYSHWIQIAGMGFQAKTLCFQWYRTTAAEWIENRRRMAVRSLQDLLPGFVEHFFVIGVFPENQALYYPEEPLALFSCASSVGNSSGREEGSSTMDAKRTALHVARGFLDHHKCSVDGWPCLMDFSRADATLMASSGSATSISFFRYFVITLPLFEKGGMTKYLALDLEY